MGLRNQFVRMLAAALLGVFAFGASACCAAAAPEAQRVVAVEVASHHHAGDDQPGRAKPDHHHGLRPLCASLCGALVGASVSDRVPGDWAVRAIAPAFESAPGARAAPATPPPRA